MVRCHLSYLLKLATLVVFIVCIGFLWIHSSNTPRTSNTKHANSIILTKENEQFLLQDFEGRLHPKIVIGGIQVRDEQEQVMNASVGVLTEHVRLDETQRDTADPDAQTTGPDRDADGEFEVNYNVHAFYYAWYGNPGQDGRYYHWNHEYLPHWDKKISDRYPTGQSHNPPDDIGSSFYPQLGPYSSLDETVTRAHMMQLQQAGIGVLSLSWYPPGMADDHGQPIDPYIPVLFDIADQYKIKICFHIEPYKGRSASTLQRDLKHIKETYGDLPAFYRYKSGNNGSGLPLVYVYDSYLLSSTEWRELLKSAGQYTIRGTEFDAVVIGLMVEQKHIASLHSAGFDGFYTYFAADKFSHGSIRDSWMSYAMQANNLNFMFIPSVGPGYDDLKVRPWNDVNTRGRENGAYYEYGWQKAISCPNVPIVSITSFNEWHEGTQIEPASSQSKLGGFNYLTYEPYDPEYYLRLTKKWSQKFFTMLQNISKHK